MAGSSAFLRASVMSEKPTPTARREACSVPPSLIWKTPKSRDPFVFGLLTRLPWPDSHRDTAIALPTWSAGKAALTRSSTSEVLVEPPRGTAPP